MDTKEKMNVKNEADSQIETVGQSQIVLYQPDETISLEVKLDAEHDTVWLSTSRIAQLFIKEESNIRRHIGNVFSEGELERENNVHFLHVNGVKKPVSFYNLDVIISVGYRVHSHQGVVFRRWATSVLKNHLLHGYSVNRQLVAMQERIDNRFSELERQVADNTRQIEFFVKTNVPPVEQVFFEGDFYTARVALESLVKSAMTRVIIIDAYVSALTLDILDSRKEDVDAVIYTVGVGNGMQRLMYEHDKLFPDRHVDIRKWKKESHDRWLVVDDRIYHCGHSLNANGGHKISAIALMGFSPEMILSEME